MNYLITKYKMNVTLVANDLIEISKSNQFFYKWGSLPWNRKLIIICLVWQFLYVCVGRNEREKVLVASSFNFEGQTWFFLVLFIKSQLINVANNQNAIDFQRKYEQRELKNEQMFSYQQLQLFRNWFKRSNQQSYFSWFSFKLIYLNEYLNFLSIFDRSRDTFHICDFWSSRVNYFNNKKIFSVYISLLMFYIIFNGFTLENVPFKFTLSWNEEYAMQNMEPVALE